jgi:dihydroxyacetone kinase-like protein
LKNYLDLNDFKEIIVLINSIIDENKEYLSQLDSVIGDGDHGITISSGFKDTIEKMKEKQFESISELLIFVGNNFMATVGGTTGPIFGYLFLEMGRTQESNKEKINLNDLFIMFSQSLNKIMKIGGAKPGEKTMVDTLNSAVNSLNDSVKNNDNLEIALKKMNEAAKKGLESTKNMVATKGRARYLGERSIGYQDAGATSTYFILSAFSKILEKN